MSISVVTLALAKRYADSLVAQGVKVDNRTIIKNSQDAICVNEEYMAEVVNDLFTPITEQEIDNILNKEETN